MHYKRSLLGLRLALSCCDKCSNWRFLAVFYLALAVDWIFNSGKEKKTMKYELFVRLAVVVLLVSLSSAACSTLAPQPTVTPVPTETPIPPTETPSPEPTATMIPTQASVPSRGVITKKPPANPQEFTYAGGLMSMPLSALTTEQQSRLVENILNDKPFSVCPEIWIEAVPDSEVPTYALFITASPDDHDKQFAVVIRSTTAAVDPGGSIGMGTMNLQDAGKSLVGLGYSPAEGSANPDELEIQLAFPGCDIFTETVKWPG